MRLVLLATRRLVCPLLRRRLRRAGTTASSSRLRGRHWLLITVWLLRLRLLRLRLLLLALWLPRLLLRGRLQPLLVR